MNRLQRILLSTLLVLASSSLLFGAGKGNLWNTFKDPYYKTWPLFHFYPAADTPRYKLDRIGPVGISIELRQPAFTMHITQVEADSPAAACGRLKAGQIIESINGKVLKDIDPRVILGNLITEAEAADGVLKMMVKDNAKADPQEVVVQIPPLGAYSNSWPLECAKSEKIVRTFADFLAKHPRGWGAALFLLSTGEEKDLDVVRNWFSGKLPENARGIPWSIGYTGPAICEYYLRTGDKTVLPAIRSMSEYLKETIYNGSWMGRGGANYRYMGGGHMNAAGVHCLTFLLLAKECGVDVDEHTLQSCLYHFYRYVGHWNVSYGDGLPEGGGVDNGKNGGLAFAMAAAASLVPEGEDSVYAKARNISANKSFYTTSWLFHGHTGGGIGELWRGAAAGLLVDERPNMYRSFMNERRWMYELARTHDGAFGWAGGTNVSYNSTGHKGGKSWGNYVPLIYTIPRKQLRIFGAPATQWSKPYALPKRPWGTEADEAFYSLQPGEYKPGKRQDLSEERLPTHASWPLLRRLKSPDVTDEELLMFAHHPDSIGRGTAAGAIKEQGRTHLILPLLKSADPRGRLGGVNALGDNLTEEQIKILGHMISDPKESWWVVMHALRALRNAPAESIAPYADRFAFWLEHKDWWLRHAALTGVVPIATVKPFHEKILPLVGKMIATNRRAVALQPVGGLVKALGQAAPEVQTFAATTFAEAYKNFRTAHVEPGGQDLTGSMKGLLANIAANLAKTPGGFDKLYGISKERFPDQVLPHKELYLGADPNQFGPAVKKAFEPIVLEHLIPKYIGAYNHIAANSDILRAEAASQRVKANYYYREPRMAGLVRLYQRVGIHDYDWHDFGPGLTEFAWKYHSFDPAETKIWEKGWRYRKVTSPAGMENWFKPDFDAEAAGWKTGRAPFGQLGGQLVTQKGPCTANFCRCSEPMQTLWEKEVLLLQTKVQFPPFKENHRYRLLVGGMSHVNRGDGFEVYINGKPMLKRKAGVGKREGGKAICYNIDKPWWPVFEKEVTIAAKGFLSIPPGKRSPGVKNNHFSVWIQEMACPPITDEMILRGKAMQPLVSSDWQVSKEEADRFLYDGTHIANDAMLGEWVRIGEVATSLDFNPGALEAANPPTTKTTEKGKTAVPTLKELHLQKGGTTNHPLILWSGDTLMDLRRYEALKMEQKTIDNQPYLFVEVGGFDQKKPTDWKTAWMVMKRK